MAFTIQDIHKEAIKIYGEDKVDLQGNDLIIWFPRETVTNEMHESTVIYDIYAKVKLRQDAERALLANDDYALTFIRSTFTKEHMRSKYIHSHLPSWFMADEWKRPCLGTSLMHTWVESLKISPTGNTWKLFLLGIRTFVRTESTIGIPYVWIKNLGAGPNAYKYPWEDNPQNLNPSTSGAGFFRSFLDEYLETKNFRWAYNGEFYYICEPMRGIVLDMSRKFIDYYNGKKAKPSITTLFDEKVLIKCMPGTFNYAVSIDAACQFHEGERVLTFKGKEITLNILEENDEAAHYTTLLNPAVVSKVVDTISKFINFINSDNATEYKWRLEAWKAGTLPAEECEIGFCQ